MQAAFLAQDRRDLSETVKCRQGECLHPPKPTSATSNGWHVIFVVPRESCRSLSRNGSAALSQSTPILILLAACSHAGVLQDFSAFSDATRYATAVTCKAQSVYHLGKLSAML